MLNKTLPLSLVLMSALLPAWASSNEEEVPANENAATQQIVQMIEESVRAEAKNGLARRDAHAKAHGCVQAQFRVLDNLPEKARVGIFGEARAYPAWIRYSNGSGKVQDDSVGDARGMAIKRMGVERSDSSTQDFLMISHPVFFVRNAADYVEFQKTFSEDSPLKFFFHGFNPFNFRLHEFRIANAIRGTKVSNPLYARYWSTTPYRFGDTEMKFSARPCSPASPFAETAAPNFLRENIQKHLAQSEACFDFLVQLRKLPTEMPIEDPTIEWSEKDSPFIPWPGSQSQFRRSPHPNNWRSARTSFSRPGMRSLSISLWAGSTACARQSTTRSPVFVMNSMAKSAVNRQASERYNAAADRDC